MATTSTTPTDSTLRQYATRRYAQWQSDAQRVEGFATEEQWGRAYDEITEFEGILAAEGMVIVKFWMHISSKEQLRRFRSRQDDPPALRGS